MSDEFRVHRLNGAGLSSDEFIARGFHQLLSDIRLVAERGDKSTARELALVVTNLQTACFWAKRAIAMIPENQETLTGNELELTPRKGQSAADVNSDGESRSDVHVTTRAVPTSSPSEAG